MMMMLIGWNGFSGDNLMETNCRIREREREREFVKGEGEIEDGIGACEFIKMTRMLGILPLSN